MLTKTNAAVLATGALAVTLGFTSPSQDSYARLRGAVAIDGSSTVFPITQAVAEEFKEKAPNVNVTVGVSGRAAGSSDSPWAKPTSPTPPARSRRRSMMRPPRTAPSTSSSRWPTTGCPSW